MLKFVNNVSLCKSRYIKPILPRPVTIEGYQHYLISFFGGVLINTITGNIVKGWLTNKGYRRCCLYNGKKKSQQYIHRLVALSWIYNSDTYQKTEVNHINWVRHDCNASNLEWVTPEENLEYRYNQYTKRMERQKVEPLEHIETPEIGEGADLPF